MYLQIIKLPVFHHTVNVHISNGLSIFNFWSCLHQLFFSMRKVYWSVTSCISIHSERNSIYKWLQAPPCRSDSKQPDANPKWVLLLLTHHATITYLLKNGLNHSTWLSNFISCPKTIQYKYTTMTNIFHLVFQFQLENYSYSISNILKQKEI